MYAIHTDEADRIRTFMDRRVVPAVDRFRRLQDSSGRVVNEVDLARDLLHGLIADVPTVTAATGQMALGRAFTADASQWLREGLHREPTFARVAAEYDPGDDGQITLLVAPIATTNGLPPVGRRLECCLSLVELPPACRGLVRDLKCRFGRFITGSAGYRRGNCIVSFSEQIRGGEQLPRQSFALFLMNKFQRIFLTETMPIVRELFGDRDFLAGGEPWDFDRLTAEQFYNARCSWAAAHERFHQQGPRPLDENLTVKTNWYCGLLEEIKVDAQVVLAARRGEVPDADLVVKLVLFDRLFRYPRHPTATTNFDAGTGVLLFEFLFERGSIYPHSDGMLRFDGRACFAALDELVAKVEAIEEADDGVYQSNAKEFVRSFLPAGVAGNRFKIPHRYATFVRPTPPATILDFSTLPY